MPVGAEGLRYAKYDFKRTPEIHPLNAQACWNLNRAPAINYPRRTNKALYAITYQ